jgi:hypothetical protein
VPRVCSVGRDLWRRFVCVCVDVGLLTRRRSGPWIEWWEQACRCVVVDLGVYAEETNSQRCIFEVAPSTSNVPSM